MLLDIAALHHLGSIDTRNGLHQVMFAQVFIEIHHLLKRSIKTGQQAVADTENGNARLRFIIIEIFFETLDGIHVGGISARPGDVAKFIVV